MLTYEKVVFVSRSDTCRGPIAASIFNRNAYTKEIRAVSRGIVVLFPEPANPKAVAVAKTKGIHLENHKTKQLEDEDFGEDILILVMSEKWKASIYKGFKDAVNVYTLREFVDESGDVGNPYGGELQEYAEFCDDLEKLVNKVIHKLYKEENE